jgi:ATP-dependent 26S proteasome regulatory subunit
LVYRGLALTNDLPHSQLCQLLGQRVLPIEQPALQGRFVLHESGDHLIQVSYQIKAARFPAYKYLAGFDFAASEVNEALVRQLHCGDFMENADNVALIGGPGTGKSQMAAALGVQAVEHHRKKFRFFATVDLVNALEQEKIELNAHKTNNTLDILAQGSYLRFIHT